MILAGVLIMVHDAMARGGGAGGFRGGGYRGGGGGGVHRGGGEYHGGGQRAAGHHEGGQGRREGEHSREPRPHPSINPDHHLNPDHWRGNRNVTVYDNYGGYVGDPYCCDDYGAADDAMAGMAMATATDAMVTAAASADSDSNASEPSNNNNTTVVVEPGSQPPIVEQGSPIQTVVTTGGQTASLPSGCRNVAVNGGQFYECGQTWYKPFFGPTGVYYQTVASPVQ